LTPAGTLLASIWSGCSRAVSFGFSRTSSGTAKRTVHPIALKLPAALAECGKQRLDTAWIQPCNARSPIKEIVLAEKLSRFDWINR
jgi:hypothetical protein